MVQEHRNRLPTGRQQETVPPQACPTEILCLKAILSPIPPAYLSDRTGVPTNPGEPARGALFPKAGESIKASTKDKASPKTPVTAGDKTHRNPMGQVKTLAYRREPAALRIFPTIPLRELLKIHLKAQVKITGQRRENLTEFPKDSPLAARIPIPSRTAIHTGHRIRTVKAAASVWDKTVRMEPVNLKAIRQAPAALMYLACLPVWD